MARDARFWRNVTIIAVAHIAVLITLVRWSRETPRPNLQSIVWMSGGAEIPAQRPPSIKPPLEKPPQLEDEPARAEPEEKEEPPVPASLKSDIQLPAATPTPVATPPPKPSVTPVPKASPKPTARPTPKATPKRTVVAKATPKPTPKKKATPAEQEKKGDENRKEETKAASDNPNNADRDKSASTGPSNGAARASEFSWYGKMLHDRFYSEWIQPTTSVAVGAKMSALVRIRIEKDGRVSSFTIVRPSGNVVVDESVAAIAKRVTQVDPLPKGLAGGAYYEVNINFELNPEQ
jgi:TonB family protein